MSLSGKLFITFTIVMTAMMADELTTRDGRVFSGKATFTDQATVRIGGQSVKREEILGIQFSSAAPKVGLSDISFKLYQGNWDQIPNFNKLTIDKSGRMNTNLIDLSPLQTDGSSRVFNLKSGDMLDRWSSPSIEGRPFVISTTIVASGDGVIIAQGGRQDGFALYLQNGQLNFVSRNSHKLTIARDELIFPLNREVKVIAELTRNSNLLLTVDGREAAKAEIPGMFTQRPQEGLSVGFDQRPSLVGEYRNDHYFQGSIKEMQLRIMGMAIVYSGKLNLMKAGNYTFNLTSNAHVKLEINGTPVANEKQIPLEAGTSRLKLVYAQLNSNQASANQKNLSLEWAGPGLKRQPLTAIGHRQISTWHPADTAIPSEGILTANGSFLAKPATDANRTHISVGNTPLERKKISTLFMRPLSIFETRTLADKPAGVLLMDGTFTEGKLLRLDNNIVTVSSILFGLKKLKRGQDAVAVVINPVRYIDQKYSILLHDDSHLFGQEYRVHNNQLELPNHPLQRARFPLNQIIEIIHEHKPGHIQQAEARWEGHSEIGQQFLGERTRKNMKIIIQFREAQFKLAAAEKIYAKASRALPAAEKAEAAAKIIRDAHLPKLEAPKTLAQNNASLHKQRANELKKTLREQEDSCSREGQAYVAHNSAIHSRRYEALKNLAQLQIESMNLNSDERPKATKKIEQAANQLKKVNQDIQRLKQTHLAAQTQALASDTSGKAAQQAENKAWEERLKAKHLLEAAMEVFNGVDQNYQAAKFTADQLRHEIARSKRDSEMAKGKIGILEPSLQTTFRP